MVFHLKGILQVSYEEIRGKKRTRGARITVPMVFCSSTCKRRVVVQCIEEFVIVFPGILSKALFLQFDQLLRLLLLDSSQVETAREGQS